MAFKSPYCVWTAEKKTALNTVSWNKYHSWIRSEGHENKGHDH